MGPSGNGLVGADERRAKNSAESRAYRMGAPVRFQKAVSRSKENAAVERREARRSALWAGNPVRGRKRPSRKAGQWVRRSAPANFGAPLPSLGRAKGSKPTIWHDSPPGCAARQRSPSGQRMYGETMRTQSKKRAACSHLILRSRAQRGVSKDGDALRCSPPFETPAAGGLLRVRPKGKRPFGGTNPRSLQNGVLAKRTRELEQFQWLSAHPPSGLTSPRT